MAKKTLLKDISGERFSMLIALDVSHYDNSGNAFWRCICDCGRETKALGMSLRNGHTKCCGCLTKSYKGRELTAERLRELLIYDPETGFFEWRLMRRGLSKTRGTKAGSSPNSTKNGYIFICVDYKVYTAHRLAWLYMTGKWPEKQIDHTNRDRADNRWANLRHVNQSQNTANQRRSRRNSSGYRGVSFVTRTGKWMAQIRYQGKNMYIGTYDTPEEAAKAWRKKAEWFFGEFLARD